MKMIIRNTSSMDDDQALECVRQSFRDRKNKESPQVDNIYTDYTFPIRCIKFSVCGRLNKSGSETFYVMNYYLKEESDGDQ